MVQKFDIINLTTQEKMTFGFEEEEILLDEDSIDWGTVGSKVEKYNFPKQVGYDVSSSRLLDRTIKIVAYVWAGIPYEERKKMTESEYYTKSLEAIEKKKKKLNALINPLNDCRIKLNKFYIEGRPSTSIDYSSKWKENNEILCKATIKIYCTKPLWKMNYARFIPLATTAPKFRFPLVLKQSGIIMGQKTNYSLVVVNNTGDVEVGAKITLKAMGEVVNPVFENVYTGLYMRLFHTMQIGEEIVINTSEDELTVTGVMDGVEYDYIDKWDFDSDFIQFQRGYNVFGYSADNETHTALEIYVELMEQFLEVPNA